MPAPDLTPLRKKLHRITPDGGVHFLTFSTDRQLPLFDRVEMRKAFIPYLIAAHQRHRFRLLAWVLMPEHFHIILVPTARPTAQWPEGGGSEVPEILGGLKKPFAEAVMRARGLIDPRLRVQLRDGQGRPRFWQAGGGFDRNVRDSWELAREIMYIHQNPVKRELVERAAAWRWSSAAWYAGEEYAGPPIDTVVFDRSTFPGPFPERLLGERKGS